MELRIALRGRHAVRRKDVMMVEIYRGIAATACRIDVDHFDIFADWPRFEILTRFPANFSDCRVYLGSIQGRRQGRIVGEDPQETAQGRRRLRVSCLVDQYFSDRRIQDGPLFRPALGFDRRRGRPAGRAQLGAKRFRHVGLGEQCILYAAERRGRGLTCSGSRLAKGLLHGKSGIALESVANDLLQRFT